MEAQAGESPTLHFSVTSDPPLTENTRHVVATENGDIVRRFKVQDNCITFRNVKTADTGLYIISCRDANGLEGKATFELNISESSAGKVYVNHLVGFYSESNPSSYYELGPSSRVYNFFEVI